MFCDYLEGGVGWVGAGRLKREGIFVYIELTHTLVQQKPTQHYKAIILQLKINLKKGKIPRWERESKGW